MVEGFGFMDSGSEAFANIWHPCNIWHPSVVHYSIVPPQ